MIRGFLGLLLILGAVAALAQENSAAAQTARQATARDGQHDFDWEFGNWHTHLWRLKQPLSGSNEWVEYDGTTVVRKIWDGRANLVELEVDGPSHIEALNLRLYNPETHKWSLNFASSKGARSARRRLANSRMAGANFTIRKISTVDRSWCASLSRTSNQNPASSTNRSQQTAARPGK
jgi:hypothetical protein